MTTKINMMVIRMANCYPSGCEITDRQGNAIDDNNPANGDGDDTDSDYDPDDNYSDTSDPPPDTPNDSNLDYDSAADLDDGNSAIIINHVGVDHHIPISGVETNHDNLH